jgi:hypothetical protein
MKKECRHARHSVVLIEEFFLDVRALKYLSCTIRNDCHGKVLTEGTDKLLYQMKGKEYILLLLEGRNSRK